MKKYWFIFKKKAKFIIPISIIFIIYATVIPIIFKGHSTCLIKEFIGIPCPTCGMTRAYLAFFRGDILNAFYNNPLFWTVPIILMVIIFSEIGIWKKLYKSKLFWISYIIILLIFYILRMIYIFPNPPMEMGNGILFNF